MTQPREPQSHEMELVRVVESGGEHWVCNSCGRQILLWWPPRSKRTVLVPGDENATHSACKGEIQIGPVSVQTEDGGSEMKDEMRH
jgi:hypothetical protein